VAPSIDALIAARAIQGVVHVDAQNVSRSTVRVEIDATRLRVTGKGDPPDDVPKVQAMMLSEHVLDVTRYPTIGFTSGRVSTTGGDVFTVVGDLTLHHVTRSISLPVTVRMQGSTLTATGHFTIRQTDYGIKPVSVGGVVAVKDELTITFTVIGEERSIGAPTGAGRP
jgi:polyisoprenoid-binding protein YceI